MNGRLLVLSALGKPLAADQPEPRLRAPASVR